MRTTITLSDDVAAAVDRIRRDRSVGLSEVVNELVRAGLAQDPPTTSFAQRTYAMGGGLDYNDIADTIETLGGPAAR